MKFTDCAIQDLKKYSALKNSLENVQDRINILNERFTSISGINTSKEIVKGGGSKQEDYMLDNIVERSRLQMALTANAKLVKLIEKGLNALNTTEKIVLEYFFINKQHNHVEALIKKLHLEQSQVYRLKEEALYKFTINMYGIVEL